MTWSLSVASHDPIPYLILTWLNTSRRQLRCSCAYSALYCTCIDILLHCLVGLLVEMKERKVTRIIGPPASATVNSHDPSYICVKLNSLSYIAVPAGETSNKSQRFLVTACLVHTETGRPMGSAWRSEALAPSVNESGGLGLRMQEPLYFHTRLSLQQLGLVLEVVKVSASKEDFISCGWTLIQFKVMPQSETKSDAQLYYGSPRCLPVVGPKYPSGLKAISSCEISYSLKEHPPLRKTTKFIPENLIVSGKANIPGIEKTSGHVDSLEAPKLSPTFNIFGNGLKVSFIGASLEEIEKEVGSKAVSDLLNEMREYVEPGFLQNLMESFMDLEGEKTKITDSASISEWNLRVSVHNGSCFIGEGSKFSLKKKQAKKEEILALEEFEIPGIIQHHDCVIVFQLEAIVQFPIELLEKKREIQTKNVLETSLGGGATKTIHVKQWKFNNEQNSGNVEISGDASAADSDFRFIFQTKARTQLNFSFSKTAKIAAPRDEEDQGDNTTWDSTRAGDEIDASQNFEEKDESEIISQVQTVQNESQMDENLTFREDEMISKSTPRAPRKVSEDVTYLSPRSETYHGAVTPQELREVPHASPQAPVIALAGLNKRKPLKLSRKSYAHIISAGFPQIKDDFGNLPTVVSPDDVMTFDPKIEVNDPLAVNELVVQFLAFSKSTVDLSSNAIQSVFFTFQLYKYPTTTTPRMKLSGGGDDLEEAFRPFILQRMASDDSLANEPPGTMCRLIFDPLAMKHGEQERLVRYLSTQKLTVDAYDGDSLLHLGSCLVDLHPLLRQGRPAVQASVEYQLVLQGAPDSQAITGNLGATGTLRPTGGSPTKVTGHVHLRLANVGHAAGSRRHLTETTLATLPSGTIVKQHSTLGATARHRQIAARLPEVDRNLNRLLQSEKENLRATLGGGKLPEEKERKLMRMRQMRNSLLANTTDEKFAKLETLSIQKSEKLERLTELKIIDQYRNATKEDVIQNMLLADLTTEHTIYPNFGTAELIEFQFRNPHNEDKIFIVSSNDPTVTLVRDERELRQLKAMYDSNTPFAGDIFTEETAENDVKILLKAHELVYIPFKYISVSADQSVPVLSPISVQEPRKSLGGNDKPKYSVKLSIKDNREKPVAILALHVVEQPVLADQTFRFSHPEKTVIRKAIRLPPFNTASSQIRKIRALCSDPNTIVSTNQVTSGQEPRDVMIKTATGPSPCTHKFYVAVYEGDFLLAPAQVWLFLIDVMKRIDVACVSGQASRFSLVLKSSGPASRVVKVFVSDPGEMEVSPADPFILTSSQLVETELLIKPLQPGLRQYRVHVVDVDYRQLTHAWLINCNTTLPLITKAFQIKLPVGGGKGSVKKLPFTNNYAIKKSFFITTDRPDLLSVSEPELVLNSGEGTSLGLVFLPVSERGATEILLYINDDHQNNEDTYCIKATYL